MTRLEEFDAKLARVRAFLADKGYDGVALTTQANFAWLTCGGDDHVAMATEGGVAKVLVTADAVHLLTNNIEAPRLTAEELGDLPIHVQECKWYDDASPDFGRDLIGGLKIASDGAWPAGSTNAASDIARLRWELLPPEIDRYRWIGEHAVKAMYAAAHDLEPGLTENEIAADLAAELLADGIVPAVLLIATDERCFRYRHPIPTGKKLEKHAMLVIGARKWGLGVSATRMVHFGKPDAELARKHESVCRVDSCFIGETLIGNPVKNVFQKALSAYESEGFGDQWQYHHQGGATGYAPRDYRGMLDSDEVVLPNQAFAWNPSIAGTKSEDTILATPDGPEILSQQTDWPMIEVEYGGKVLERPAILVR